MKNYLDMLWSLDISTLPMGRVDDAVQPGTTDHGRDV